MIEEKEINRFDSLIREKLKGYELPVEGQWWEEVEGEIRKRGNRSLLRKFFSGLTAAAACAALLFWIYLPGKQEEAFSTVTDHAVETEDFPDKHNYAEGETSDYPAEAGDPEVSVQEPLKKVFAGRESAVLGQVPVVLADTNIEESLEKEGVAENVEKEEIVENEAALRKEPVATILPEPENVFPDDIPVVRRKKEKNFLLAASFGSSSSANISSNSLDYFFENNDPGKWTGNGEMGSSPLPEIDFSEGRHSPALSFGITVRKRIDRRFSLESGLIYSYLHSELEGSRVNADQKLHYLGVPLTAVCDLYKRNNWTIYISGGGMVEKGIRSQVSAAFRNGNWERKVDWSGSVSGLQWSVNASAGIDYRFYNHISFYLEPRLTYYFDNNQPESIRTQNPLTIGFGAGVRFNW